MSPLDYKLVAPGNLLPGWIEARPYLAETIKKGKIDEEYLLKEIQKGEAALVQIYSDEKMIGALVYAIGTLDGRRILRVHLLGGKFQPSWMLYLQHFLSCIASSGECAAIEFLTLHKADRVLTKFGYEEIGTIYRRSLDGIEKHNLN